MTKGLTMRLIPALMMLGFAGVAGASGFALQNQTGSGNGNAFAGAAAAAEDAGTVYWNPAGMSYLGAGHSISLSGTVLDRSIKFKNTGTTNSTLNNATPTNGGDGGGTAFLPAGFWAYNIAPDTWVGIGVSPTFGNKTEYSKNFIGRNSGYYAEIEHININPSLAFKVNDVLSLGFGADFTRATVRFKQGVPVTTGVAGQTNQNYADLESDASWGFGGNIGAMFQLSPSTRVGLTYRSGISFDLQGKNTLATQLPALGLRTGNIKASGYETPGTLSMAVSQKLSDRWEMLGDLTWTDWSVIHKIVVTSASTGATVNTLPYNFRDTWRIGLGANYQYNDALKLRFGVAFDQTPVQGAADRTMTLPDSDRVWLSFGGKYNLSKDSSLDMGYSHIFFRDADTNRFVTSNFGGQRVVGEWNKNRADILSVQYNHKF